MRIIIFFIALVIVVLILISCRQSTTDKVDGIPGLRNITVEQAKQLLDTDKDIILLDVRTPEETTEGMIPGARTIDVKGADFKEKISALDRDKSYLVYCRSGSRSSKASNIMIDLGFKDVRNMKGGFLDWAEQYK